MIAALIQFLSGRKTFIVAALLAALHIVGPSFLTPEQMTAIQGLLAAFGLAALRLAVAKNGLGA